MNDLVVLCADGHWQVVLDTILAADRAPSLGLDRPLQARVLHVPGRTDSYVRQQCATFLAPFADRYRHGLAICDHDGCGDLRPAAEIEAEMSEDLARSWEDRATAIVVEPELEEWLIGAWAQFDRLPRLQGVDVRGWWRDRGHWPDGLAKPPDPKRAVDEVLRAHRMRGGGRAYATIAERASLRLDRCRSSSFHRFVSALHGWFRTPPEDEDA